MTAYKPLIGLTAYYVKDRELDRNRPRGMPGQDMLMSTMDYPRCIKKAGGIPVVLPVGEEDDDYIENLAKRLDGFLFTGGSDVYPLQYGQSVTQGMGLVVTERDEFELKLLAGAVNHHKPIFGICRGLQIINIFFGGTLCQDIYAAKLTNLAHMGKMLPKFSPCHKVTLAKNSKVFSACRQADLPVNSFHHQVISTLGSGLIATGWSEDGIIEAVEHGQYDFLVGVQWHPEMMAEVYSDQLNLFKAFIDAAQQQGSEK